MKVLYDHNLTVSFVEYLNNRLLQNGSGFSNANVTFYPSTGRIGNYAIYSSPYGGFAYDASVSGAVVPSGISGVGGFIPRGTSGLSIDWNRGRAIFSGAANSLTSLSGRFSVKDFNFILWHKPEERLLFESKFVLNNPVVPQTLSGLKENEVPYPAIYVVNKSRKNTPFAFGGQDQTETQYRCIVIADDPFKKFGVNSVFGDLNKTYFGYLFEHETPFGFLGDIKSGDSYNYMTVTTGKTSSNIILVDQVYVSDFDQSTTRDISSEAYISIIDFDIKPVRYPRVV